MLPTAVDIVNRRSAFQQLMRRWSRLHPYNAVHWAELAGPAEPTRLRSAATAVLSRLGLATLTELGDDRCYRLSAQPSEPSVRVLPAVPAQLADARLAELASEELNTPFALPTPAAAAGLPIRLVVLPVGEAGELGDSSRRDASRSDRHWLGLCYDHWLGDGTTMGYVLAAIAAEYLGQPTPSFVVSGVAGPDCRSVEPMTAFGGRFDAFRVVGYGLDLIRDLMRVRWCYAPRADAASPDDLTARAVFLPTATGLADHLRAAARRRSATVNDLFLAALAEAVAACTVEQRRRRRRRDLALGSMMDLRQQADPVWRLPNRVGLYLAYFAVFCRSSDLRDFEQLVRRIAAQTSHIKRTGQALRCLVDFWISDNIWTRVWPNSTARRYRKHMPMAGGVSNLRLPSWWDGRLADRLLSYRRIVPTGPSSPLALAPTTVNGRLELGLTVRPAGFDESQIRDICATLTARLSSLA